MLSDFKCQKNNDLELFLKNSAIRLEKADKSRTFLLLEEKCMYNKNENFRILGYFSLSNKTLIIPKSTKNTVRRKLDGINNQAEVVECYLIGQLGKNCEYENLLEGKILLDYAISILRQAKSLIGRRIVLVEAVDDEKVLKFYFDNGFTKIEEIYIKNKDEKTEKLHQLIKRI